MNKMRWDNINQNVRLGIQLNIKEPFSFRMLPSAKDNPSNYIRYNNGITLNIKAKLREYKL